LQIGLGVFSALIIIASLFGVTNTLLMSILERTREIGLMKALGMTNGQVLSLVTLESAFLGFWGGVIGILIAFLFGNILNSVASNTVLKGFEGYTPLDFSWTTSLIILAIIILVCYVISFIPARRAVKIQPTQALNEE
jgi:putative ABC transport system permease protein